MEKYPEGHSVKWWRKHPQELAEARAAINSESSASAIIALPNDPLREWKQPLNRADSISLLVGLMGTYFVLILPPVWSKVPAFVMVCLGFGYFIWFSHLTYHLRTSRRMAGIVAIIVLLGAVAIPQFVEQWHMEHMRSELGFNASIPGIAYPDGDHYGIKWFKTFVEVRLNVASKEKFPIQNLYLSVWPINKAGALAGMAQTDPEPQGCVVRAPRDQLNFGPVVVRGIDGSRADISPFMNDMMNKNWSIRDHYDLLCQRILAGESIPLIMAVLLLNGNGDAKIPSSQFHIKGDYETTAAEGSKRIPVDETVNISTLPPWK